MYLYIFIDPDEWRDILWVFVSEGKDGLRVCIYKVNSPITHSTLSSLPGRFVEVVVEDMV